MASPSLEVPPVPWRRVLSRMASKGAELIERRAFPTGGRSARSAEGRQVKALTEAYARRKRRLGRPSVADQRLTSKTARSLGVIRSRVPSRSAARSAVPSRMVLGFRSGRERVVAESLQRRNQFMGHTRREVRTVVKTATVALRNHASRIKVRNGKIVVDLSK